MKIKSRNIYLNFYFQHGLFKDVILFLVTLWLGFFARDIQREKHKFCKEAFSFRFGYGIIQIKFQTSDWWINGFNKGICVGLMIVCYVNYRKITGSVPHTPLWTKVNGSDVIRHPSDRIHSCESELFFRKQPLQCRNS